MRSMLRGSLSERKKYGRMYWHQFLLSRELGGGALVALQLSTWLKEAGAVPQFWVPGMGPAAQAAQQYGLSCLYYGLNAMAKGTLPQALACIRLAMKLRGSGGIAHVHSPAVYRMIRPALRLTRLRTVVHMHLHPTQEEVWWALQDPPELLITCARYMGGLVQEMLGERGAGMRIAAVPNAVDTDRFFPADRVEAKQRVGAPQNIPLVLMLANLAPHKGQETAIRAVAELQARGTAVECWLAGVERHGGKEYTQYLVGLARDCGVGECVRFLGSRNDSPDLLRAADFLLLPSTLEGLPLSILEAQATKVPVLAAPTAGVPEMVHDGVTGFLIPATDALLYAERIQSLLRNPDLSQRVAQQAYDIVVREYNWPTYCARVWGLYQELLALATN
jgi:glycosyltransferase involved in cell wall biosynthesis